ncbi:hypothetical protein ADJ79_11530 [Ottowia sp. oral taxon 894]|nr:hypothetical protein ADJ79_11530 [Ottowia sp. oral taxon 894]
MAALSGAACAPRHDEKGRFASGLFCALSCGAWGSAACARQKESKTEANSRRLKAISRRFH